MAGRTLLASGGKIEYVSDPYLPLCINQEQLLLSREVRGTQRRLPPTVIPVHHRIAGPLDLSALRTALQAMVERHAALRTSFHYHPALSTGEIQQSLLEYSRTGVVPRAIYVQHIASEVQIELATHTATRSALPDLIRQELARDFDRDTPPRIRASVFKLADDEHLLVMALDHLVSDGWSVRLLERELYSSPGDLQEPGMSFPDFARWQNESFETPRFHRSVRYWLGQWERFGETRLAVRDFPFALAGPAAPGSDCASCQVTLDPICSGETRRVAAQQRITLFMLFLAAWALVLRKYTGKERFPVWTHFNNRVRPETHGLCGYLINTHIIGLDLSQNPTGREVLEQVRRAVLEAAAHQEVPLPQCWRSIGAAPRFDDAFVMLDFRQGIGETPAHVTRATFPEIVLPRLSKLGVYVTDYQETIDVSVVYWKNAFREESMRLLPGHFSQVLTALIANPAAKLSELSAFRTS